MLNELAMLALKRTPGALVAQSVFMLVWALSLVYSTYRIRKQEVVILSHTRLWMITAAGVVLNLAYYHLALFLHPGRSWTLILFYLGVIGTAGIQRAILHYPIYWLGGNRALADTNAKVVEESEASFTFRIIRVGCLASVEALLALGLFARIFPIDTWSWYVPMEFLLWGAFLFVGLGRYLVIVPRMVSVALFRR